MTLRDQLTYGGNQTPHQQIVYDQWNYLCFFRVAVRLLPSEESVAPEFQLMQNPITVTDSLSFED